jgi:hypothetical protein
MRRMLGLVLVRFGEQHAEIPKIMYRAQPGDHRLESVAQARIGRLHVGPERVAADLRDDLAAQDRVFGRVLPESRIAVPDIGGEDRIVLVVVEHQNLRKLALRAHGMDLELAEQPADGDVLRGGQVLVAQDQHLVLDQGRFESPRGRGAHVLLEIETMDLRAQPGAQPLHPEGSVGRRLTGRLSADVADVDVHVRALFSPSVSSPNYRTSGALHASGRDRRRNTAYSFSPAAPPLGF